MALSSSRRECTESWSGSQGPIFVIGSGKRSRGGVMRTVGIAGWVVIVGALLVCQGLAIVLVFHVWLARDHAAMRSAVTGGAALLAIVLPMFVLAGWFARRRARSA